MTRKNVQLRRKLYKENSFCLICKQKMILVDMFETSKSANNLAIMEHSIKYPENIDIPYLICYNCSNKFANEDKENENFNLFEYWNPNKIDT